MSKLIYLDNAATTQVYPEVLDAMLPYFTEHYGNPAAIYSFAGESERAVAKARKQIADVIGAKKEEIYFTAGGSESDNWALKATFEAYKNKGNHIITTKIEHHAILHTCEYLEKRGAKITYVDVDENGMITDTPPTPNNKPQEVDMSTIEVSTPRRTEEPIELVHEGRIEHFNVSKGYGFVKDLKNAEKYFFHISGLIDNIIENNIVTFELEKGSRGMNAVKIKLKK